MQQEAIATKHEQFMFPYQTTDIPDAAGTMNGVQATSPGYVANYDGFITGFNVRHNASLAGGTITWRVTINGTANTTYTFITDSSNQQGRINVPEGGIPFKAGDRIGMDWTKTGTVSPTTTDAMGCVFGLFKDMEF